MNQNPRGPEMPLNRGPDANDDLAEITQHVYGTSFMGLATQARHSAQVIVDLLHKSLPVSSVADFGCALGTWLSVWRSAGVTDIAGVDGPYVRVQDLQIPRENFCVRNLSQPIDLGRKFSLVESTEVAEHLPEATASVFVASLVRHSDLILFSAAPPGQGGEFHVNEQPYEYWRRLFGQHGYLVFDWVRPRIAKRTDVQYWYRYNLFLFASAQAVATLPAEIRHCEVAESDSLRDYSPWWFQLRKQVVRRLPAAVQTTISRAMSQSHG